MPPLFPKVPHSQSRPNVASLKLWLDGTDTSVMDKGTSLGASGPPANHNDVVKYWGDKSGNGHHATSTNSPKYYLNTINGHPAIHTQSAWFNISDSATAFDAWDSMTFFITWKWNGGDYWHAGLRKHNAGNGNNQSTGFSFDRMNVGAGQSSALWWGTGSAATRLTGSSTMNAYDPMVISVRYDGSSTNLEILCEWQVHHKVHQYRIELCFQLTPPKLW